MYLIPIGWLYVALMMAVAEATNSTGTLLGALITFVLYGLAPVLLVVYLMGAPQRRRSLKAREAAELAAITVRAEPVEACPEPGQEPPSTLRQAQDRPSSGGAAPVSAQPDAGGKTPADAVTPVRKKP